MSDSASSDGILISAVVGEDHHGPFPAASLDAPPRWLPDGTCPAVTPVSSGGGGGSGPRGLPMSHRGPEGKLGGLSCCVPVAGFSGCGPMALAGFLPAASQRPGSPCPPLAVSPIVPFPWFSSTSLGWESPVHLLTEQEGNWVGKACSGARASEAGLAPGRRLPTLTWCPCLAWRRASGVPGSPKPRKQCFFSRLGSPRACSAAAC